MASSRDSHDFYGRHAKWWPLISPVEDYASECRYLAQALSAHTPPIASILEFGSGGGHVAFHLRSRFKMTLTDLSEDMSALSRRLNPTCDHLVGDMRTIDVGRTFDAVLVHDAIDYMTTEDDLRAVFHNAARHLIIGGLLVLAPDHTTETFEPGSDMGGSDGPDGNGVRFLDWTTDPDPQDTTISTDYLFMFLDADGTIGTAHETHVTGLFPRQRWLDLLEDAGFAATAFVEETDEDRTPRDLFAGVLLNRSN
jgi:SAM-dependent methyltransferase